MKRLRQTLPYRSYGVETATLDLVKNEGQLSATWVSSPSTSQGVKEILNELTIGRVLFFEGGPSIQLLSFGYNRLISFQVSPNINTPRQIGIRTDVAAREGTPTVVGTLGTGNSGEAIILVLTAQRAKD